MAKRFPHARTIFLVLLIVVSVVAGRLIPAFYAWTDSDQSRPSPLLWKVPLWAAIATAMFCCILPMLRISPPESPHETRKGFQFGLRTLLIATTLITISIPLGMLYPLVVSGIICAAAFACQIALAVRIPSQRFAAITFFACMILPYSWMVTYEEFGRTLISLPLLFGSLPTLYPGGWLSYMLGQNLHDSMWVNYLLTAMVIFVGIWLIQLGPKRTIAYLLFVTQMSLLGSLALYQAVIA
jgi:hypothetical protein